MNLLKTDWKEYSNKPKEFCVFRRIGERIEMQIILHSYEPFDELPSSSPDDYVPEGIELDASKRSFLVQQVHHKDTYVDTRSIEGFAVIAPFWERKILIRPQVVIGWDTHEQY